MLKIVTNAGLVIKNIKNRAKRLDKSSDKAIQKVTAAIATHIKERTLKGRDKNGKSFKEYSNSTLEYKQKRGGKFFNGNVNLNDSGKMMSSMQSKRISSKVGVVRFTRKEEAVKALKHIQGKGKLPKRNFFGLSKRETTRFIKVYKGLLKL